MGMHSQSDGGKKLYLNVSCGKFVNKKQGISAYAYSGKLEKVEIFEDEFEGKPMDKVRLTLKDEKTDETCLLTFTAESFYALGFFARINNIKDFDKAITIGVSKSEQNEKISFCWLKQGETKIGKTEDFIKPEKMQVSKNTTVTVWTKCIEQFRIQVEQINAKTWTGDTTTDETGTGGGNGSAPNTTTAEDDDLPF